MQECNVLENYKPAEALQALSECDRKKKKKGLRCDNSTFNLEGPLPLFLFLSLFPTTSDSCWQWPQTTEQGDTIWGKAQVSVDTNPQECEEDKNQPGPLGGLGNSMWGCLGRSDLSVGSIQAGQAALFWPKRTDTWDTWPRRRPVPRFTR